MQIMIDRSYKTKIHQKTYVFLTTMQMMPYPPIRRYVYRYIYIHTQQPNTG